MQEDIFESTARKYEQSADELEAAAQHLRIAAQRFRDKDVPRDCAHAFAAYRHMCTGQTQLDENAVLHASKAQR